MGWGTIARAGGVAGLGEEVLDQPEERAAVVVALEAELHKVPHGLRRAGGQQHPAPPPTYTQHAPSGPPWATAPGPRRRGWSSARPCRSSGARCCRPRTWPARGTGATYGVTPGGIEAKMEYSEKFWNFSLQRAARNVIFTCPKDRRLGYSHFRLVLQRLQPAEPQPYIDRGRSGRLAPRLRPIFLRLHHA